METESESAPLTPEREALAQAERAFAVGDHARLRELVKPLLDHPDGSVSRDAVAMLTKISVDPAQVIVLALSFAFFVYIAARYVF